MFKCYKLTAVELPLHTILLPCDCNYLLHKFDHSLHNRHLMDVEEVLQTPFHLGLQTVKDKQENQVQNAKTGTKQTSSINVWIFHSFVS